MTRFQSAMTSAGVVGAVAAGSESAAASAAASRACAFVSLSPGFVWLGLVWSGTSDGGETSSSCPADVLWTSCGRSESRARRFRAASSPRLRMVSPTYSSQS